MKINESEKDFLKKTNEDPFLKKCIVDSHRRISESVALYEEFFENEIDLYFKTVLEKKLTKEQSSVLMSFLCSSLIKSSEMISILCITSTRAICEQFSAKKYKDMSSGIENISENILVEFLENVLSKVKKYFE